MSTQQVDFQIHNMPAVYVLETHMPDAMVADVNEYMDKYRESKHKASLKGSLVGQIHKGEQLLLDHNDPLMKNYNDFITNLLVLNRWAGRLSEQSVENVNVWLVRSEDARALERKINE